MDYEKARYPDLIEIESIPPLPATAARLLTMAADRDVEMDALAAVIERDPPLTARVLGVANSVFYAPRQPVTTVKAAIVTVLGLNVVRNMAFGMALTGGLTTAACPRFDLTGYWVMALGTADLASGLARASTRPQAPDPDVVYLAGLLHNLGELLLVHLWPDEMGEAIVRLDTQPATALVDVERALIGLDHWRAGAFLARHWQLPPVIADTIGHFELPAARPELAGMLHLLRAARRWLVGATAGRNDPLRVAGVDESYCDYRAAAFLQRHEALRQMAGSIA